MQRKNYNRELNKVSGVSSKREKTTRRIAVFRPLIATLALIVAPLSFSDAQRIPLSSREIAVVGDITCGYVNSSWVAGRSYSNGSFLTLKSQLSSTRRAFKTATGERSVRLSKKIASLKIKIRKNNSVCTAVLGGAVPQTNPAIVPTAIVVTPTLRAPSPDANPRLTPTIGNIAPTREPRATQGVEETQTPRSTATPPAASSATPQADRTAEATNTVRPTRTPATTATSGAVESPQPVQTAGTTPTAIPRQTAASGSTATPRPTRTSVATPRVTATPSGNSGDDVRIAFSLIDPCEDTEVRGFNPISQNADIDLQNVPASSNIRAVIEDTAGTRIGSVRFRLRDQLLPAVNSRPFVLFAPSGSDIAPGDLPVGRYKISATAYSGDNGQGTDLGTSEITVNVQNTSIAQKATLGLNQYVIPTNAQHRVFEPTELANGCVRAGAVSGSTLHYIDVSNHGPHPGKVTAVDAGTDWNEGSVGIGEDGSSAVARILFDGDAGISRVPFAHYSNNGSLLFKKEVQTEYSPAEFDYGSASIPKVTGSSIHLYGYGFVAAGSTSGYTVDYNKSGTILGTGFYFLEPAETLPVANGGFYRLAYPNNGPCGVTTVGYSNPLRNGIAGATSVDVALAENTTPLCSQSDKSWVHNDLLYVVASGAPEFNSTEKRLYLSIYNKTGVVLAPTEIELSGNLKGVTVLEDGIVAVLFESTQGTHILAFYNNVAQQLGKKSVALSFSASGIKGIKGGKIVAFGPEDLSDAVLSSGKGYVAVIH
jgi:hypothetical protein